MPVVEVFTLPAYPSSQYRMNLSPSQLCSLYNTIASTLKNAVSLPPNKRDDSSTRHYVATYAHDVAFQTLQNLIWKGNKTTVQSTDEKLISNRSLSLAKQLASTPQGLDMETLLDLSIVYARGHLALLHAVFVAALTSTTNLPMSVANDLVPNFTLLLSQQSPSSQGLYGKRKVAECVYTFLRACKGSPELIRPFAHNKEFILAFATLYDVGMTAISVSYGGIPALVAGISAQDREPDDWERIWTETKVALIDSFHIIISTILNDLASAPTGPRLAVEAEHTFEIVFALLEQPTSANSASDIPLMPFLNQSLLADYQHCYDLSKMLASALKHAGEKDERLDLLESMLKPSDPSSGLQKRDAGALKILLRSSGIQPGIDNLGTRTQNISTGQPTHSISAAASTKNKGKGRATSPPTAVSDPDLYVKATQVLDILPDMSLNHIQLLLSHDKYSGNPEKVIEALLEGTAMNEEELEDDLKTSKQILSVQASMQEKAGEYDLNQRTNVFDKEVLDVSKLRQGKKDVGNEFWQDRSFIEQMKADILRRAEDMSDDEDEDYPFPQFAGASKNKDKSKNKNMDDKQDVLDPDYDEGHIKLRVGGGGEDLSEDDDDDSEGEQETQSPQSIIELAYLRDPALFERDAATRRSKAREELRVQTGWADEQIEGWKVMLDRTPGRKNKLEEKYAFTGNEKGLVVHPVDEGRNRGGARGGFRGGRGRGRGSRGDTTQDRAWKEKNKAGKANHNRKRGHDKKMARAGAGPSNA